MIVNNWKIILGIVGFVGFVAAIVTIVDVGKSSVCKIAQSIGKKDSIPFCNDTISIDSEHRDSSKKDTIKAETETIEEGTAEEMRAFALIDDGYFNEGLKLLKELAAEICC